MTVTKFLYCQGVKEEVSEWLNEIVNFQFMECLSGARSNF